MVEAQPKAPALTGDSLIEEATQGWAIRRDQLHSEAYEPAAELIHDHQDPVRPKQDRLGAEEVQTPKAALEVAQEGQPGWTAAMGFWTIRGRQHSPYDVFVDL